MTKYEIVKQAINHIEGDKIPYAIHLTREAFNKYGNELYEKYVTSEFDKAVKDGTISRQEAIYLSIGNYVFPVNAPWWSWYDVPETYKTDFDAPNFLPKTIGAGSYEGFKNKVKFIKENTDRYVLNMIYGSHFEKAQFARGIENFLADMAGSPEYSQELLDFIIHKNIVMLENIVNIPEIDGILLGSDWGTQNALMISPDDWRTMIKPGEIAEYKLIKEAGKNVWIHSCGNIELIMPDLVEMGVDVLNPLQPECMDIDMIKATYGEKLTFWGGISTQQTLPYGTAEDVKNETINIVNRLRKNGGYIIAPSQELQFDVPFENACALIDTARTFG